jgi:UPF0755 protein
MNDLDMDFLLGAEDDDGRGGRRSRGSGKRGNGRRRRRRRNRGGLLAPLLAFLILAGIIGGGGYYGYRWANDALVPDDYTGKGTEEVVFEVKDGQIASDVAQELERQGIVASARAFTNAIGNAGKSDALQPGTYKVRKKMPAADVVKLLLDPKQQVLMKVRLAEGLRLSDIYTKLAEQTGLDRKKFEAAAKNVDNLDLPAYAKGKLEGYAFPATYDFPPKATAGDVLARMVQRFHQAAEKADLVGGAKSLGHTPHEIVTIASIIQAEAARAGGNEDCLYLNIYRGAGGARRTEAARLRVDPRRRPAGWPRCRLRPGQDGIAGQGDRRHPELSAWRLRLLRTPGD